MVQSICLCVGVFVGVNVNVDEESGFIIVLEINLAMLSSVYIYKTVNIRMTHHKSVQY